MDDRKQANRQRSAAGAGRSRPKAVCLFSSAGIGELGLSAAGLDVVLASELIPYRVAVYAENFPETKTIEGDIWDIGDEVVSETRSLLGTDELFLLYATPPCQGMSSNGAGKLRAEIEAGRRLVEEPRNRLIIPTLDVICALQPRFVLLENVPQMKDTVIRNERDRAETILGFVSRQLGPDYVGAGEVVACDDFGIPQRRRRLVSIFTRDPAAKEFFSSNGGSFFDDEIKEPGATLKEAIGSLPPLDSVPGANAAPDFHPQHRVPLMDPRKYWWVSQTPEGQTAFNNQCANGTCIESFTPGHREELVDGKWRSVKDAPIHCINCGELLPRPTVIEKDGSVRPLRGFHSAYRRMRWDQTARTLTQNFIYEASDNKIHPDQNRVLSVYEAMVLQTIDRYEYRFEINGVDIGIPKIAEIIGESVPPLLMEKIAGRLLSLASEHHTTGSAEAATTAL
jgi:DNA (cytosine-5)-methyltransferase 1